MKKLLLVIIAEIGFSFLRAQIIETVAGNGVSGYSGDGGQATVAEFNYPNAVGFDGAGNMYVADESNNVIRKINSSGDISTVAGNEVYGTGFSGDGGPATAAELYYPEGVWGDKKGNFYIADLLNRRIRKVNTSGIISTFAGNGTIGYTGDGGPATAAELGSPYRVAVDTIGNVYIDDQIENCIRKVDTSDVITTVAGNGVQGFVGDGGPATAAELYYPYGLAVDIYGNIYIADCLNNRVREVNTSGMINTIAGNGTAGFFGDGGPATAAELDGPFGVAADANGNIYIDDQSNARIRAVNALGNISTLAGTGFDGYNGDGISASSAELNYPWDVSVDASGNVYIADESNYRVREVPIGTTTGVGEVQNNQLSAQIYPNPNNGKFTFVLSHPELVSGSQTTLEVYDLLGSKVYNGMLNQVQHDNEINLSSQPSGIYFYRVISENRESLSEGKIIIEK